MLSRVAADTNQVGGDIFRRQPATFDNPAIDYFDLREEPLLKYSPVMLHVSPATRILNENPDIESNILPRAS